MSAGAFLVHDRVLRFTDAILERAREASPDAGLTVVVGEDAGTALTEASETCARGSRLYRGAVVSVVPTLLPWLVMVVVGITDRAPDTVDPATFYGDLRSSTIATSLPSRG